VGVTTRVHFIGVAGTAMATLAAMLQRRGFAVAGSDAHIYPPMSTFLEREGVRMLEGYRAEHITADIDLVVVGNAVSRGNPEVEEVLDRKIRHVSLPEAIREHFLWGARSIVIAGTHGKTTTAAMAGWLLTDAGLDPSLLVGGLAANFGAEGSSYRLGGGRDFVIEGDEYDSAFFDKTAKFLKYLPDIAVVGNIEFDHADIYADVEEVTTAFRRFVNLVPRRGLLLVGADCPRAASMAAQAHAEVQRFGLGDTADWCASEVAVSDAATSFIVTRRGRLFAHVSLPMPGEHNVRNALAAIAVGAHLGVPSETLAASLQRFKGVRRRLEVIGSPQGVEIVDDFAHHPTAVAATLRAVRAAHPGRRVIAVFEPRSASSCRRVFEEEFAAAFDAADETIIAAVYRAALPDGVRLSPEDLVSRLHARGLRARFIPTVDAIVDTVAREARTGDVVVVMSNGGFGGIHGRLLQAIEHRADGAGARQVPPG